MTTTTVPNPMNEHSSTLAVIIFIIIFIVLVLIFGSCNSPLNTQKLQNYQTEKILNVYTVTNVEYLFRDTIKATEVIVENNTICFYTQREIIAIYTITNNAPIVVKLLPNVDAIRPGKAIVQNL